MWDTLGGGPKEGPGAGMVGNARKEGSPGGRKTALRAHHSCQSGCDVCGHSLIYTLRRPGWGGGVVAMVARSVGGWGGWVGGVGRWGGGCRDKAAKDDFIPPPTNSSYPTLAGIP